LSPALAEVADLFDAGIVYSADAINLSIKAFSSTIKLFI
jgi:hypothetical protein